MVKRSPDLDLAFSALSDPTRRDILRRISAAGRPLTVGETAKSYDMSLAAVSKHLNVLERAGIVTKVRAGKQQRLQLHAASLEPVVKFLRVFDHSSRSRLGKLGAILPFWRQG